MNDNPYAKLLTQQPAQAGNPYEELITNPAQQNPYAALLNNNRTEFQKHTPLDLFQSTLHSFGGGIGALSKVLNAPRQFTTGLIEKGLERVGFLQPNQNTGPINAVKNEESNIDLLRRIGTERGGGVLTGQYTPTTSVFGNFVKELPVTALGTLADLFVDPLVFASKIGAVEKGTAKAGEAVSSVAKNLYNEYPAVQKIGDMLGNTFIKRYGQRPEFANLDIERKIAENLATENVGKLVSPIIEQPAAIQQRIANVIKGVNPTDEEVKALAEPIRQELDRVGESISKLNPKLLSEETFQANKGTYFPRLYTDYEFPTPTEQDLISHSFGARAVSVPKEPFKGRLLSEAESIAKGTRIEEAGYPALKRLTQLNITEQRQKFFSEAARLASDEARPGWVQLSDDKALGDLAGKFLPAAEFKAIAEIRHVPSEAEKMYSKALTLWKTFKTAYNPATIARNDLTNYFVLNPLGGVGPHRLDIYARTVNEIMSKGQLYQLARKEGLELSTQQAAELTSQATRFYRENKGLVSQFFGKVSDFHNMVKDFYGTQDKFFKMANFIKGVTEDGLTPYQAMHRANFYMVDYSEVPKFVEWLRKSPFGVPFLSFTYGVSQPLAKTLLTHPDKLSAYFKILNGIQSMNPLRETQQARQQELDVAPDWIQHGTFLRLPVKDKYGRGQYVDLQYILPFNALESNSIKASNPLLNIFASVITNRDTFTGKDIYNSTDTTEEKAQKMAANILGQLLPSWTPFVGSSYNKVVNALQQRPDKSGIVKSKLETAVDVLGGIKITPIDTTIEAQKRASEKRNELNDLRDQLRRIMLDKSLFPTEREKQADEVRNKLKTLSSKLGQ